MEGTCYVKIQLFTEDEFWAKLTLTAGVDPGWGGGGGEEGWRFTHFTQQVQKFSSLASQSISFLN